MFKSILIFIILIIKLTSKEYEYLMKKNNVYDNDEFNPYIFKFSFKDKNYSFILSLLCLEAYCLKAAIWCSSI